MLEVQLLGQFNVRLGGSPVEIASRPAQTLFAYLALHPGVAHRRERLAGLFWPDSTDANSRRNLRQAIWQIRRAFEGAYTPDTATPAWFAADRLTIAFHPPADYRLDAALFDQPTTDCSAEELITIASAYGGELLPGFYDDWVLLEREQLQARFEQVMATLLDQLAQAQRWRDVLQWGERWIALGHTPEAAYRALMSAHAALGDVSEAMTVYRRAVEALRRDLGVEPSEQTRALRERISTGQASPLIATERTLVTSPAPQVKHNLPVQMTSFIGRVEELAEIRRMLAPAPVAVSGAAVVEVRLLTLTGVGGTGKTRLALQAAVGLLDAFSGGVWLIELAALSDPDLIPQTVAAVLGVREEPHRPLMQSLTEFLRTQSLLLILDNCEHLIEACASFAAALLRACPGLKIIATSRETLGMPGETVLRVPSLTVPSLTLPGLRALSLADLSQVESVRLFIDRATAVRPAFQLTDANAAAIAQICHRLDGVPLAIELAAARVHAMTVEQIAARLDDRFRLLTGGSRTALPRQQTLRAMIDWSWDLLPDVERVLLRRLSVFVGGWTLDAAEAVAGVAERVKDAEPDAPPDPAVLDLLTRLVQKSLVIAEEQGAETRYLLLETIRQYARSKLLESGEAEPVRSRHLRYCLALSAQADPCLRAASQMDWLARLEMEHDNMRAALKWALNCDAAEAGLLLASHLYRFWYLRGYWKEGREWLNQMLSRYTVDASSPEALLQARANALCGAGWLAADDGTEISLYTEALALCRQIGDRWGQAFALRGMVSGFTNWENVTHMRDLLQESLALCREVGDPWCTALTLHSLGWLEVTENNLARAQSTWDEGLQLFRHSGDQWGVAVTLVGLGFLARTNGDYPKATGHFSESLALFRELGDQAGVATALTRLGGIALRRGDYAEAKVLLEQSHALSREQSDPVVEISCLALLGLVSGYQGDLVRAMGYLEESLSMARGSGVGSSTSTAYGLMYMAFILYNQNEIDRAEELWREALALFELPGEEDGIAYTLYGQGLIALRRGDRATAAERLNESLTLVRATGDQRYIAIALNGMGKLKLAQADAPGALASFGESLLLSKQIGDKQGVIESLEGIAVALTAAALPAMAQATRLLSAAQALRHTIGAPLPPVERAGYEQHLAALRAALGEAAFAAAWDEGQAFTLEQAIMAGYQSANP